MSVELSVVIPAYNEETRLPTFLATVTNYLAAHFPNHHEVIVVNDGSTDGTAAWLANAMQGDTSLRQATFETNRGKGAAVRAGVLQSTGRLVLFCDADGATPIAEERRLRRAIDDGADVAVGSRFVRDSEVKVQRALSRRIAGRLFALAVRLIMRPPVRDTQCGFKMFRGDAGRRIALQATEDGYLFDLEWLGLAHKAGLKIAEVAVHWTEQPGSKLRVGLDGFKVVGSLHRLRRRLQESPTAEKGSP